MTTNKFNLQAIRLPRLFSTAAAAIVMLVSGAAQAGIDGITDASYSLAARAGYISVPDGGSIYSWGYTTGPTMQLPGPTLKVTAGQTVTVTLTNNLPSAAGNVSIVFPGHEVSASGGVSGELAQEATPGSSVTYTFTAAEPGTYTYHSGTQPDLQVEMGLYGALIVYPVAPVAGCAQSAYDHPGTCYDREYLYLLSEVDLHIHRAAEAQAGGAGPIMLPGGAYHSEYWLLNGRAAPDTMAMAGTATLPTQPYDAMTRMHPGERVLMRVIGAGREMHPFHHHGNHARVLAHDGRLIRGADDPATQLAGPTVFTIHSVPGGTTDAIFEWTGKDLGWDMYGHTDGDGTICDDTDGDGYNDDAAGVAWEWCADHNEPIPVTLPALSSMGLGGFYSGSPFLGAMGSLPPGEGGLNPGAGFAFMWHSHTEREMVNNDVFPGGMMTMLIVEAPWVVISD